jgi:rsbT co-antagonist protein RsbR
LVGIIDSKRAQDVMTTMLERISSSQSKVFILDISGVAVVDTAVANYLIKMTKAAKLMGCLCIISGIAGSVAQTIVELGINIDEIQTTGSMQDALKTALKITGTNI